MEKLNKSIIKEYLPVKIYLCDLQEIILLLVENGISYEIETENYKYENIIELTNAQKEGKIKSLTIRTHNNPYITIEFHKTQTKVYVSSDVPIIAGLFYKIDKIIKETQRAFSFCYSYAFTCPLFMFFLVIAAISDFNIYSNLTFSIFYAINLIWFFTVLYIRGLKHSVIELTKREHTSNFFKRKKDELIVNLILVIVTAMITLIITKYFN
ncbi:MAG: hypothetical protein WBP45_11515 [Daejeonella sp.]